MSSNPIDSQPAALSAADDGAVACDLSPLAVLAVAGSDASSFLNGQLSVDVAGLAPARVRYACFNSPKGRMLANFVIWCEPPQCERFLILLPGEIAPTVAKRLSMYVLRSKVTIADESGATARIGVGGPGAARAIAAAFGEAPSPYALASSGPHTVLGLPGPRYIVVATHADSGSATAKLRGHVTDASYDVWRWLTIRAGVPVITAATQDMFVAQTANWEILGGVDFQKGCYTGQEIIARMQYLGRLKERAFLFHAALDRVEAGERLYSTVFGDQPCGTVVNAARAPEGGCDLIAVVQLAAAERADVHLRAPDGPALAPLPLPYAIPAAAAPRNRQR
jgi:tRNA-modifying protein YgfZ